MIGAVVLAAGESRRMGENKLLVEIEGRRMIEWIISSFKGVVDELIVVLGHKPESMVPILKKLGTKWVVNENYAEGMASSFKKGLNELKHCDAVFLALGDQPFVDRDILLNAVDTWKSGAKIVSPVYEGKKGHPVLFDKSLFDEILSLEKQGMIRDVIHRHESEHHLVEAGEWAIIDVDTPETLEQLTKS
jgi:molybdenum cofactor cytidylyltransferase